MSTGAGRVVAVVGGGVAGLAAARVLAGAEPVSGPARDYVAAGRSRGRPDRATGSAGVEVVVLEAAGRLGGKVLTGSLGGVGVELGPDQFLRRDPSAERLCAELGLASLLHPPAVARAAVYSYGRLRPFPDGLVLGIPTDLDALARSGIVSAEGVRLAALDATAAGEALSEAEVGLGPDTASSRERAAGALLRARLGDEVVDRLVDPLLGGINAGSLDGLSLAVVAPQVARALVGHHDVVGPLRRLARAAEAGRPTAPITERAGSPGAQPPSPFLGLEGGLGRLVDALCDDLGARRVQIRTDESVIGLRRDDAGLVLDTASGPLPAAAVVLAVPGRPAAGLLADLDPAASRALSGVAYASVVVVTFSYRPSDVTLPEALTGFVVPRVEGMLTSAVTFLSRKWPWMSAGDRMLIRVSAGRLGDDRALALGDDALVAALRAELAVLLGIATAPLGVHVQRWEGAFPQYAPGHRQRVRTAQAALARRGDVALCGALLGGVGLPACIASGEQAAADLLFPPA